MFSDYRVRYNILYKITAKLIVPKSFDQDFCTSSKSMKESRTSWNHDLLRKYSNTGHFRLLNQLRNELKQYPIIRQHINYKEVNNIKKSQ